MPKPGRLHCAVRPRSCRGGPDNNSRASRSVRQPGLHRPRSHTQRIASPWLHRLTDLPASLPTLTPSTHVGEIGHRGGDRPAGTRWPGHPQSGSSMACRAGTSATSTFRERKRLATAKLPTAAMTIGERSAATRNRLLPYVVATLTATTRMGTPTTTLCRHDDRASGTRPIRNAGPQTPSCEPARRRHGETPATLRPTTALSDPWVHCASTTQGVSGVLGRTGRE